MTKLTQIEIEFLRESNAIECVFDQQSLKDAIMAWEFIKNKEALTHSVVSEVHKILMKNQPIEDRLKGSYRDCGILIGGRAGLACALIPAKIDAWITSMNTRRAWKALHVEYEKIHPFVDGNGRTGRIFMNWHRRRLGLPILVIKVGQQQHNYYKWFV